MIGRKALADARQAGRGAAKKKRWKLEIGQVGGDGAGSEDGEGGEADVAAAAGPPGSTQRSRSRGGSSDGARRRSKPRSHSRSRRRGARRSRSGDGARKSSRSRRRSRSRRKASQALSRSKSGDKARPDAASDEEDAIDEPQDGRHRSRSRPKGAGGASPLARPAPLAIAEVTSFSDFVRHCDRLVKLVGSLSAAELVLLCRNMAQAKYYDGDLMAEVWRILRTQIILGQHGLGDVTDIVGSLRELNAYDQGVFRAAAAAVTPQVPAMSREQRQFWIDTYRDLKHQGDDAFARVLARGPDEPPSFDPGPGGKAARIRQVLCMLHGKQRSIDMMVDEGGGHYTCAPNRRCK